MCKDRNEQKKLLLKLRNMGCHFHNLKVLREGKGSLVVVHRPSADVLSSPTDFVPCPSCFGYFKTTLLYKHHCPLATNSKAKGSSRVKQGKLLLLAVHGPHLFRVSYAESAKRPRSSNSTQPSPSLICSESDFSDDEEISKSKGIFVSFIYRCHG